MTTWNLIQKYASQTGITYNEAAKTYNQASVNYGGKLTTVWTNQVKN